jgi:hypothetical protein
MPQPIAALMLKFAQCAGAKERCHAARDNVYRPCGPCGFAGACQFWICTARYNFQDLTANNNGDCVQLSSDIGRPSLTETSDVHAVTGAVVRGSARMIVIVGRTRKRAKAVATDLRYGAPRCPTTTVP